MHRKRLLAETDPRVGIDHGPARVEFDQERDQEPERQPNHDDQDGDDDVERALHQPVGPGERRRPQLEEGKSLAGHVLAPLDEELGGPRSDPHLDAATMRPLDELEQLLLVEPGVGDDQLVEGVGGKRGDHPRPERNGTSKLVVDPTAARAQHRAEMSDLLGVTHE